MKLQFESEAEVPQESKESFVEFEMDGKKIWMHKDVAEAKKEGYRTQGHLTNLRKEFDGFKSKIEAEREEAIRLAKEESEARLQAEMEKFKKEGKTNELFELEKQQLEDKLKAIQEEKDNLNNSYSELKNSLIVAENEKFAAKIASEYCDPKMAGAFSKLLVLDHIKNVDGKPFFVNASGEAVDGDISRILDVIGQDETLKPFEKFNGSKPGYQAKGGSNQSGGSAQTEEQKRIARINAKFGR